YHPSSSPQEPFPSMDLTTLHVLLVIFLATLIRSTFGFGEALVAVPLLALRLPITTATPLAVLVSVLVASVVVAQDWRHVHFKSAAGLLLAALAGIPLGLFILRTVNNHLIKLLLAATLAAFSLYSLTFKQKLHLRKDHPLGLGLAGFCSGILGGAFGMNGPPLAVYGALRRWSPQHFRATLQGYFLPASILGLFGYAAVGLWSPDVTRYFLLCLPVALFAILLGRAFNRRLSGDTFLRYVYVGLLLIATLLALQTFSRPAAPVTQSSTPSTSPPQSSSSPAASPHDSSTPPAPSPQP
ncbi:MAG TPA: sulfite exporter TauE/SafE family protein, partial [Phycisphaerae bacterium]|nr:sulfite exporter TauE/SafE family protein [Phycisphaerae bacterium]